MEKDVRIAIGWNSLMVSFVNNFSRLLSASMNSKRNSLRPRKRPPIVQSRLHQISSNLLPDPSWERTVSRAARKDTSVLFDQKFLVMNSIG